MPQFPLSPSVKVNIQISAKSEKGFGDGMHDYNVLLFRIKITGNLTPIVFHHMNFHNLSARFFTGKISFFDWSLYLLQAV